MLHAFATLGFTLIAAASVMLIWSMLSANRAAISAALGMHSVDPAPRVAGRRIRVRSVQPATLRTIHLRRAA